MGTMSREIRLFVSSQYPSSAICLIAPGLYAAQKIIEDSGVRPPAHDVEGAEAFVRASADLRHRHSSLPQSSTSKASGGPSQSIP